MHAVADAVTPEQLLALPDEKDFELVDGRLVERNMGSMSSWVGGRFYHWIANYCEEHALGLVWPADNGMQCFPGSPNKVRKPDVTFVRRGRLPDDLPPEGYLRLAPDLVVEVVSPNDLALEVDRKVMEYLAAGVRLVWIVNPDLRVVRTYAADGTCRWLREDDELTGGDVLPGFVCRVETFFPPTQTPG